MQCIFFFDFVYMHLLLHLLLLASCILPAFLHTSSRHIPRIPPSAECEFSPEGGASAVSSSTLSTVVASHFGYSFSSDDAATSVLVHEHKCATLRLRDSIIFFFAHMEFFHTAHNSFSRGTLISVDLFCSRIATIKLNFVFGFGIHFLG